jgi:hypothetical protein
VNKIGTDNFRAACINRRALAIVVAPPSIAGHQPRLKIDQQQRHILAINDRHVPCSSSFDLVPLVGISRDECTVVKLHQIVTRSTSPSVISSPVRS